jgi:integrase
VRHTYAEEQLHGETIEPIVIVALATGLRQGEVLGLVWEDVDFTEAGTPSLVGGGTGAGRLALPTQEGHGGTKRLSDRSGQLHIRRELVRRNGRYYRDELKTPRSRRSVPLPPPAVEALRVQRDRVIEAGFIPTATGAVFPARRGGPLNGSWVTKRLQAAMLRAGVGQGDFRMLRRTFASRLFAAGVPDRYIADLMGHTAVSVTHGHYISTGTDAHRALQALEEMLA